MAEMFEVSSNQLITGWIWMAHLKSPWANAQASPSSRIAMSGCQQGDVYVRTLSMAGYKDYWLLFQHWMNRTFTEFPPVFKVNTMVSS
jgi:hypothetical protein